MTRSILLAGAALISVSISPLNAEAFTEPRPLRLHNPWQHPILFRKKNRPQSVAERRVQHLINSQRHPILF